MAITLKTDDRVKFENAIESLQSQMANIGAHLTIDSTARVAYAREIRRMADKLRGDAMKGKITWAHAAKEAQETRNLVMMAIRARSTPVGLAMAQKLKLEGKSLNELIELRTRKLHGEAATFARLSSSQKNTIFASIVTSAGNSNPAVTRAMARLSYAGKGVLVLSLGLAVYNIATAKDKGAAIQKELVITGAGIGGGIASGALAGLVCGPGAPVCVTVGAFVGGALAAVGSSYIF